MRWGRLVLVFALPWVVLTLNSVVFVTHLKWLAYSERATPGQEMLANSSVLGFALALLASPAVFAGLWLWARGRATSVGESIAIYIAWMMGNLVVTAIAVLGALFAGWS